MQPIKFDESKLTDETMTAVISASAEVSEDDTYDVNEETNKTTKNIIVIGAGIVGISTALWLQRDGHSVTLIDIVSEKVDLINQRESPIEDSYISEYLESVKLDLNATTDQNIAYKDAELVIVATPTDYDPATNFFNTKSIEDAIDKVLKVNKKA